MFRLTDPFLWSRVEVDDDDDVELVVLRLVVERMEPDASEVEADVVNSGALGFSSRLMMSLSLTLRSEQLE